ncbi:DUF2170 family protein [Chitinibacteraceae bacterium HSL-7]
MELSERVAAAGAQLAAALGACETERIAGDVEVLRLSFAGREELPIFVTASDQQLLCICYLWTEADVRSDQRTALLEALLDLNIAIPLSSFGRIGTHYVLYGALASDAGADDLASDILALSDNALDALDAMAPYLN